MMEVSCLPLCRAVPLARAHAHTPTPPHHRARWHRRVLTSPPSSVWSLWQWGQASEGCGGDPTGPQESTRHQGSSLLPVSAPSTASDSQIPCKKRFVLSLRAGAARGCPGWLEGEEMVSGRFLGSTSLGEERGGCPGSSVLGCPRESHQPVYQAISLLYPMGSGGSVGERTGGRAQGEAQRERREQHLALGLQ